MQSDQNSMSESTPRPSPAAALPEPSLVPEEGRHCNHLYYRWRRDGLAAMSGAARRDAVEQLAATLNPEFSPCQRYQLSIISGHKADFGLMLMDPDPLKIDAVHQAIMGGLLGPAIEPTYSFVSMSEISEYVPSVEQYAQRLMQEGETPGSPTFEAKVNAYRRREPVMRKQRLAPDFVDWPANCFYPMNKWRVVGANWFALPFSERYRLMAEHAQSGMQFAGRVTQLITVAVGLDDWEWGVTLWARNPQFLKDIVYKMRFDQASARYAEFGPFFVGYRATPHEMLTHCRVLHAE